jgi:hypothetical protein
MSAQAYSAPPADAGAEKDPKVLELRELYEKAHVAFLAGRYLDAAAAFDAGYAQSGMVAFLYNSAVAWEKAGNLPQSVERYAQYMTKNPDSEDYGDVKLRVAELRTAIAEQREATVGAIAETKGVIILTSSPGGAEVRLDNPQGPVWAITPYSGTLPPGEHIIYVTMKGYKDSQRAFPDNSGKVLIGHFGLSEEYFLGQLEVKSVVQGADVYLRQLTDGSGVEVEDDGSGAVARGSIPFSNQIAPGSWEVRVARDGYVDYKTVVEIQQGKIRTLDVELEVVDTGRVTFHPTTEPGIGSQVFVTDSLICEMPCTHEFPPGHYEVTIKQRKMKDLFFEIDIERADRTVMQITMEPATRRAGAYVAGSLMLATAGVGTWFALDAKKIQNDIQSDLDNNVQFDVNDPRRRKGAVRAIVADSLFGATAILGSLTLYYALRQTGKASSGIEETETLSQRHQPIIAPAIGPDRIGIAGSVRF